MPDTPGKRKVDGMPWCPKCKSEYREGFRACADCGCELVETLPEEKHPLTFGTEEEMAMLAEFLDYSGIEGVEIQYDETEDSYDLSVPDQVLEKAAVLMRVFLVKEQEQKAVCAADMTGEDAKGEDSSCLEEYRAAESQGTGNFGTQDSGTDSQETGMAGGQEAGKAGAEESRDNAAQKLQEADTVSRTTGSSSLYQDSSQKADDNRSSAWVLTITGVLGIAIVVLGFLEVLPFQIGNPYLIYGVMGVIFLLFVIAGIISMKNAKFFAKKAESENSLRSTLLGWCRDNLKAGEIDEELSCVSEPEEVKYFNRTASIKEKLNRQFMNLDQDFLDQLVDDQVYEMVFGESGES